MMLSPLILLSEAAPTATSSAADPIVNFLLQQGTSAAFTMAVLWILLKKMFNQYENRIIALEASTEACNKDRRELHQQIHALQQTEIADLKRLLETIKLSKE